MDPTVSSRTCWNDIIVIFLYNHKDFFFFLLQCSASVRLLSKQQNTTSLCWEITTGSHVLFGEICTDRNVCARSGYTTFPVELLVELKEKVWACRALQLITDTEEWCCFFNGFSQERKVIKLLNPRLRSSSQHRKWLEWVLKQFEMIATSTLIPWCIMSSFYLLYTNQL